jgi:hypothetical protein
VPRNTADDHLIDRGVGRRLADRLAGDLGVYRPDQWLIVQPPTGASG